MVPVFHYVHHIGVLIEFQKTSKIGLKDILYRTANFKSAANLKNCFYTMHLLYSTILPALTIFKKILSDSY